MKYNMKKIMTAAWRIYRKAAEKVAISFGEALHRAWLSVKAEPINAARVEAAKAAAGIAADVETRTWAGWREAGYEVIHGSKAVFGCDLIWGSKGDNQTYKARFFTKEQVAAIA